MTVTKRTAASTLNTRSAKKSRVDGEDTMAEKEAPGVDTEHKGAADDEAGRVMVTESSDEPSKASTVETENGRVQELDSKSNTDGSKHDGSGGSAPDDNNLTMADAVASVGPSGKPLANANKGKAPSIASAKRTTVGKENPTSKIKGRDTSLAASTSKKKWQPKAPSTKPPMKEAIGCTEDRSIGRLIRVSTANMEGTIPEDSSVVERLESMLRMHGAFPSAINLCTADPAKLTKKVARQVMTEKTDKHPHRFAVFFLLGVLTHDALDLADGQLTKHICLAPFQDGFARALAVLRVIYGAPYLLLPSFRGGITFSTARFEAMKLPGEQEDEVDEEQEEGENENENEDESGGEKEKKKKRFRPVLPKNVDVPVLDARYSRFLWSKYAKLPKYQRDVPIKRGTICAVTFTMGSYEPKARPTSAFDPKVVKTAMSFNIQSLIVLETPDENMKPWAVQPHELDYSQLQRDTAISLEAAMNNKTEMGSPVAEDDEDEEEV